MSDAPDRIWVEDEFGDGDDDQWAYGTWDVRNYRGYVVEYVRADRIEALTAQLESTIKDRAKIIADLNMARWARDVAVDAANATVRKLATAEAERDRLREALFTWVDMMNDPSLKLRRKSVEFYNVAIAALKGESRE